MPSLNRFSTSFSLPARHARAVRPAVALSIVEDTDPATQKHVMNAGIDKPDVMITPRGSQDQWRPSAVAELSVRAQRA